MNGLKKMWYIMENYSALKRNEHSSDTYYNMDEP